MDDASAAVIRRAREDAVEFVRLQFTDILGVVKNVAIPVRQLERALEEGIMFDGSSIEGFTRIEESDMRLRPDPSTYCLFPGLTGEARAARLICDVVRSDGEPFEGDPRMVLKRVLQQAADMGFRVMLGPECEFFLFRRDPDGKPTTQTHDEAGYFDLGPVDQGEAARQEIVLALESMGFDVEASHHEVAPGQHEIDFRYDDALVTADRVATLKVVTRTVAARRGLHATFMPKPIYGVAGSGMHTHLSLFRDGENAFYEPAGPYQLSSVALHFVAGLLEHARAFTAVTNPLVNSYKRLVPGYEAPVYISWSAQNRSALVRVPSGRGRSTRVELRSPDPSANPYLAFAVIIAAGLDGVRRRLSPPESHNKNIYHMTAEERQRAGIRSLPGSLEEAVNELVKDELVVETLGSHVFSRFVEAKRIEWDVYRTQVHRWEVEQYLGTF
ncbi:MAG: type I glutamate--ammonia ligase [Limnochordaceae bacterium]|uniref:Glutamine synthetase n=1 Tax=Carboxydichorda subterranea TaxID=3109565 RepID=A0ABZ1BUA4_9FIRM|nr:type I glutamate--ammonia ligase [Limnochorda sp. L945t]MBE3597327.1 type I glutamate--ammonia ligase [Limnochordaceae bacterium]WRP16377.1 type I glutamate--ammonia ligase [Limnochorda sp. L945t]